MTNAEADVVVEVDDPQVDDVRALLEAHLAFARGVTPICDVHALGVDRLVDPAITLFTARQAGSLLGVGALRELDQTHAEIKSMHTAAPARGRGVGKSMVEHLLKVASQRGYSRVSLETGSMEAFAPARALYASMGFEPCEPFGEYTDNPNSTCMTFRLR